MYKQLYLFLLVIGYEMKEKKQIKPSNINIERGKRLKECRELRKLSQQTLADKAGYESYQSIYNFEAGIRPLNWDKAISLAKILKVNPKYLMCESDNISARFKQISFDVENYGEIDVAFLHFISLLGFDLRFIVVPLNYDGNDLEEKNGKFSFENIKFTVPVSSMIDFCFSDYHCKICENDNMHEAAIVGVLFEKEELSYKDFCFFVDGIYEYIKFSLLNMKKASRELEYLAAEEKAAEAEIAETHSQIGKAILSGNIELLENCIKKLGGYLGK